MSYLYIIRVVKYGTNGATAKKSAVQVYGETTVEHTSNTKHRIFKLGSDKVPEKESYMYDHVGVKACIFNNDESRALEKNSKGRRIPNATTGLGIPRNGLSMSVCNVIFCAIVVPIITFGCDTWVMSDNDKDHLMAFQRLAGRRIQRLPFKSPNATSFFGLGWSRMTTFIQVKKLLFILTILKLKAGHFLKEIFSTRLRANISDRNRCEINQFKSPCFEIFNTCARHGLLETVAGMTLGSEKIPGKKRWSKLCWERAWASEDAYWQSTTVLHRDIKLLSSVLTDTKYLTWWYISDNDLSMIRICENMVKILCRTSRLSSIQPTIAFRH